MVQITIDVPDELAQRLEPFQGQLSQIFTRLMAATLPSLSSPELSLSAFAVNPPIIYQEVLDFLVSQPTSAQLLSYKVSDSSQARIQNLLQKSREIDLSPSETSELDLYEQLDSLMAMLKIRAYAAIHPQKDETTSA